MVRYEKQGKRKRPPSNFGKEQSRHTSCPGQELPKSFSDVEKDFGHMGFMINNMRTYPLSARARIEAYAGLLLLIFGLTVLTFGRCPTDQNHNHRPETQPLLVQKGGGLLPRSVVYGNAAQDGEATKGWWIGHFLGEKTGRRSMDVETKWTTHQQGAKHDGWATNRVATSMAVLVEGKHRLEFGDGWHVVLENAGDYVIWGKGVKHSWTALEKSTLLCIRWPSISGDQDAGTGNNVFPGTRAETEVLFEKMDNDMRVRKVENEVPVERVVNKAPVETVVNKAPVETVVNKASVEKVVKTVPVSKVVNEILVGRVVNEGLVQNVANMSTLQNKTDEERGLTIEELLANE